MLTRAELFGQRKALKAEIKALRKQGIPAAHFERQLQGVEARLAEMGRVHNRALLEIRTRNVGAFSKLNARKGNGTGAQKCAGLYEPI